MEKISWTDHVRSEEVLLRVEEQRNILHEISKRKAIWIGHILRRNCLLRQVIEGKIKEGIEVIGRRGRRRRKLLDDLKEGRGYSYLKEETQDRTMPEISLWKRLWTCRETDYWMNKMIYNIVQNLICNTGSGISVCPYLFRVITHILRRDNQFVMGSTEVFILLYLGVLLHIICCIIGCIVYYLSAVYLRVPVPGAARSRA
jgi:hypothetical protein